jgi:hypothetical protein
MKVVSVYTHVSLSGVAHRYILVLQETKQEAKYLNSTFLQLSERDEAENPTFPGSGGVNHCNAASSAGSTG